MQIKTRYDYATLSHPKVNFDPKKDKSLTNQADMDSADINKIMDKFAKTGQILDNGVTRNPVYGDFTEVPNYHEALSAVRRTEQAFSLLPAKVRNRFQNDPQQLIDFMQDPKNLAEAEKLGIIEPKFIETPAGPPVPFENQGSPVSPAKPAAPAAAPIIGA